MDGTLTQQGKFTASLLQALEDLSASDIPVLIVTGRSAGWVSGLVSYLPIAGAIAENGGLFYPANSAEPVALTPIPDLLEHRQQLANTFQPLKSEFPYIQESSDNRFRITDWTFVNRDLSVNQLQRLNALCDSLGWGFTYSYIAGYSSNGIVDWLTRSHYDRSCYCRVGTTCYSVLEHDGKIGIQ